MRAKLYVVFLYLLAPPAVTSRRCSAAMAVKAGRGGQTRTDDPSLPKRVRYQLRYTPTNYFFVDST